MDQPSEEHSYRIIPPSRTTRHLLKAEDEMQLADNIAFLAQWQEGVENVSAVTLQEKAHGLVICLASNHTPPETTVRELGEIITLVSDYASRGNFSARKVPFSEWLICAGKRRNEFLERIFDKVIDIRYDRILSRIRPPWLLQPSHYTKRRPFLLSQVKALLNVISALGRQVPAFRSLVRPTCRLISCLLPFEKPVPQNMRKEYQKNVIKCCVELASVGGTGMLEDHLRRLQVSPQIRGRSEIRQIDKLARYFFVCRDFIRVARRPEYQSLFRNISSQTLQAFEGRRPEGSSSLCFVHAEMQQIFYYAYHPLEPSPRFIGCSKSACYLCDMFIQRYGWYRISHAHRRLYEKWTLPDVDCSTSEKAQRFPVVLKSMTEEVEAVVRHFQSSRPVPKMYGAQSMAFLPLTSGSTVSNTSVTTQQPYVSSNRAMLSKSPGYNTKLASSNISGGQCESSSGRIGSGSDLTLKKDDLPFSLDIKDIQQKLLIQIDATFLVFEFATLGRLSIRHVMNAHLPKDIIDIRQLSTIRETRLARSPPSSVLQICLRHSGDFAITLDFVWNEA